MSPRRHPQTGGTRGRGYTRSSKISKRSKYGGPKLFSTSSKWTKRRDEALVMSPLHKLSKDEKKKLREEGLVDRSLMKYTQKAIEIRLMKIKEIMKNDR